VVKFLYLCKEFNFTSQLVLFIRWASETSWDTRKKWVGEKNCYAKIIKIFVNAKGQNFAVSGIISQHPRSLHMEAQSFFSRDTRWESTSYRNLLFQSRPTLKQKNRYDKKQHFAILICWDVKGLETCAASHSNTVNHPRSVSNDQTYSITLRPTQTQYEHIAT
jgi:hypothetical protein